MVTALLGGAILIVALNIPWLNIPVWLAMVFFGLGAQLLELQRLRPWRSRTEADVPRPPTGPATAAPPPEWGPEAVPPRAGIGAPEAHAPAPGVVASTGTPTPPTPR